MSPDINASLTAVRQYQTASPEVKNSENLKLFKVSEGNVIKIECQKGGWGRSLPDEDIVQFFADHIHAMNQSQIEEISLLLPGKFEKLTSNREEQSLKTSKNQLLKKILNQATEIKDWMKNANYNTMTAEKSLSAQGVRVLRYHDTLTIRLSNQEEISIAFFTNPSDLKVNIIKNDKKYNTYALEPSPTAPEVSKDQQEIVIKILKIASECVNMIYDKMKDNESDAKEIADKLSERFKMISPMIID